MVLQLAEYNRKSIRYSVKPYEREYPAPPETEKNVKTVEREFCKNRSCHLFPWCFFSTQFSPFFTGNIFVYGFRTAKRTRDETRKYFSFAIDVRTRRTEVEGVARHLLFCNAEELRSRTNAVENGTLNG